MACLSPRLAVERWRDMSDPVFDVGSNLDGTVSDWVAGLSADFGNPLRLETRVRLDDDDLNLNSDRCTREYQFLAFPCKCALLSD